MVAEQKEKALKRKTASGEVEPYLIVVGQTLSTVTVTYLIIDKIQFMFRSVLKAFDILFKTFFALDLKYPAQAEHIYILIQKGIFGISTINDKPLPYIEDILKYLAQSP